MTCAVIVSWLRAAARRRAGPARARRGWPRRRARARPRRRSVSSLRQRGQRRALAQPGVPGARGARARTSRSASARSRSTSSRRRRDRAACAAPPAPRAAAARARASARASCRRAHGTRIDSDHIMRLITKSGLMTALDHPYNSPRSAPLRRSGLAGPRAGGDLRPHVAARGPRRRPRGAWALHHRPGRRASRRSCPRGGRRAARVPQRLPASRRPAARGPRRLRQGAALPVPRLDLPHRRPPDRRAGGPRLPRPRQVGRSA